MSIKLPETILNRIVVCLLSLPLLAMPLSAQTAVTELSGTVQESDTTPLPRVTVELISGKLHVSTVTGQDGSFHFCCLPFDSYLVVFHSDPNPPGRFTFTPASQESSRLKAVLHQERREWWIEQERMPLEPPGTSPRIFSQVQMERLPSTLHLWTFVGNTEVSSIAERFDIAGMHDAEPMLYGSRGNSWSQNRIIWNGFDLTNGDSKAPFVPDLASIESVTYNGGRDTGRSGAELSLQSRAASPILQGQAQIFFQGAAFQNSNVTPRLRDFGITESDERYRYAARGNVQLGGPISKNWNFFAAAGRLQNSRRIRNHLLPVRADLTNTTAKVAGDLSIRDRLVLEWIGQSGHHPESGSSPQIAREASHNLNQSFNAVQASWTRTVSARTYLSAGASLSFGKLETKLQPGAGPSRENLFAGYVDIPLVPSADSGKPIIAQLNSIFTGSAPIAPSNTERQFQGLLRLHMLREGGSWTHRINVGIDAKQLQSTEHAFAFQDMNLRFFRGEADSVVILNQAVNSNGITTIRWHAKDSINLGNLAIDLSGHAGWSTGSNLHSQDLEKKQLGYFNAGAHVGAGYQIGRRYPTVVRAAVSRYHHESLFRVLRAVHPSGLSYSVHSWSDPNNDRSFQVEELGRLLKVHGTRFSSMDAKLKSPYANDIHLEISQTLPGGLYLSLHGFRRVDHDIQAFINTGVPLSAYDSLEVFDPGNDGASRTGDEGLLVAFNQKPETLGQDAYLLTNPDGESAFAEGYEARIIRGGQRFQMELAFTRYRAVARTPIGNSPLQNDWSIFPVVNDPNQSINAYGSTFFDRGLGARFLGIFQLNRKTQMGWIVSYLDGAPYGRILPVTGLNQGLTGILATLRGPGNGSVKGGKRTAHNLTADLRISREFHLAAGSLKASVDIFNLLNRSNALREADVTSPVHLWRIPLSFQTPRSLQIGLRYRW